MIGLLVNLLIIVIVFALAYWIFTLLSPYLPEPVRTIALIILVVIMVIVLIYFLAGLGGSVPSSWRWR